MHNNNCRNCGKEMFNSVLLDNKGNMAISFESKMKYINKEDGFFIICPFCLYENATITIQKDNEPPQFKLL